MCTCWIDAALSKRYRPQVKVMIWSLMRARHCTVRFLLLESTDPETLYLESTELERPD